MVKNIRLMSALALIVMGITAPTAQGMEAGTQHHREEGEGELIIIPVTIAHNVMGAQEDQSTTNPPPLAEEKVPGETILETHREDMTSLRLPKELWEIVLSEYQGSFNNASLVCRDFLELTDKLTKSLNSKDNWVFKIFQNSPSMSNFVSHNTPGPGSLIEAMAQNMPYLNSLIYSKKKIDLFHTDEIYPVFTKFLNRFKNLTSLDLYCVNLSNPTESQASFFTTNSLKQLTNLQFLHIHPRFFNAPRKLYLEQPENTQIRLSTLTEHLKELRNLSILICEGNILTDDILKCLPKLRNLDLSANTLVTDDGLKHASSLEYLCLGEKSSISPQTLQLMPKLVFLDILENKHYTNEDIIPIPNLKILFANCSFINLTSGFNGLKTLECDPTIQYYKCSFSNYLLKIASHPIGDPYETFMLELGKKAMT